MKQVKYFDVYSKGKITRYCVDSTEEYECYVRLLRYANKDTVVTHIVYDDGTHEHIDMPAPIKTRQATEKPLADFKKLSVFEKYKESVRYGKVIDDYNMTTNKGSLTVTKILYLDKIFLFILLSGDVLNCYELQ